MEDIGVGKAATVLLVDDHRLFRDGMKSLLVQWWPGVVILEAGRLVEAQAVLAERNVDLILLDLTLPDSAGPEQTVHSVASAAGVAPIAVISMLDVRPFINQLVQAGMRAFIHKSDSAKMMMATLSMVLAGNTCIPAELFADASDSSHELPRFSARQLEVLQLIVQGLSNKEIARELCIAEGTVKIHVHRLLKIIGASSRAKAAAWARQVGLVVINELVEVH